MTSKELIAEYRAFKKECQLSKKAERHEARLVARAEAEERARQWKDERLEYARKFESRFDEAVQMVLDGEFATIKELAEFFGKTPRWASWIVREIVTCGIAPHRNAVMASFSRTRLQRNAGQFEHLDEALRLLRDRRFETLADIARYFNKPLWWTLRLRRAALLQGVTLAEWKEFFPKKTKKTLTTTANT